MGAERPRLLILSHQYPTERCPTDGIFIHRHVVALMQAGAEVRVVCPVPWAPPPVSWVPRWRKYGGGVGFRRLEGIPVYYVGFPVLPVRAYLSVQGAVMGTMVLPFLRRLRQSFAFELIHSHTLTPDGVAGLMAAAVLRVPAICSVRGSDINAYPYADRLRYATTIEVLRRSRRIVAVSAKLAERARDLAGAEVQAAVIYNGVAAAPPSPDASEQLRRRYGLPASGPIIMFVGRCEQDKGVDELVDAFAALAPGSECSLVMVGHGGRSEELRARVNKVGLSSRVFFTGGVPAEHVQSLLGLAQIFVLPSWSEGMPNALLEAMAAGLPCVVTPVGGVPEVIDDGDNGVLTPVRNTAALAAALAGLLQNADLRARLGAAAARTIAARFSWEKNAREHLQLYREILS